MALPVPLVQGSEKERRISACEPDAPLINALSALLTRSTPAIEMVPVQDAGRVRSALLATCVRDESLVSASVFAYADVMYATAVVDGKVVRFKISPALARAHRANRGKTMTEREAVGFVEAKRRARALRRARPYLESRP